MKKDFCSPLIGASIPCGAQAVDDFLKLKLGNIVLLRLPKEREEALAVVQKCIDAGVHFTLSELQERGRWKRRNDVPDREVVDEVIAKAGKWCLGCYTICESGGILYWPRGYTVGGESPYPAMPPAQDLSEAQEHFCNYLKKYLQFEREEIGDGELIAGDSALVFDYQSAAGVDSLCLEMLPGSSMLMLAGIRGTARTCDMLWGVHIAMGWSGGAKLDELWLKRWKLAIYTAYMAGTDYLYPETGHYIYAFPGAKPYAFDTPEMLRVRHELRKLYRMSKLHTRPENGPKVKIALLRGKKDGSPGLWNPYSWGQYDRCWESTGEERSWELAGEFFTRCDPFSRTDMGEFSFSGNPPCGNYDIVSAEADVSAWQKYPVLILLGPNRMDETLYAKLCEYVRNGGHLLLSLAHCNITDRRDGEAELFRNGDLRELCGFRVTRILPEDVMGGKFCRNSQFAEYEYPYSSIGIDPFWIGRRTGVEIGDCASELQICAGLSETYEDTMEKLESMPLLTEYTLGKGRVLTVTSLTPPGADSMREFYSLMMRIVAKGERDSTDLLAPSGVRYALYGEDPHKVFYILNTEFDSTQGMRLLVNDRSGKEFLLPGNEFCTLHLLNETLSLLPELPESEIVAEDNGNIRLFAVEKQQLRAENHGDTPLTFQINGQRITLLPGEVQNICIAENLPGNEELAQFCDPEFLVEPEMGNIMTRMPY